MNCPAARVLATDALALCLLTLGAAAVAHGEARAQTPAPGRLQLEWQAPSECPTAAEVRASVARLLGGEVKLPPGETVEVTAAVTAGQTWRVDIATGAEAQRSRRSLESASCAELADATALLVALLIDAHAVAVSAPASPPPAAARPAATVAPQASATALRAGVLGTVGLGILPGLDAGVGVSVAIVRGAWRFDLRGSYGLRRDQNVSVASPPGAYGVFNYSGGVAGACRLFPRDRIELGACVDVEGGVLSARGYKFSEELSGRAIWLGLGPAAYVAIRAGRFSVPVRAALVVPITRPEFVFNYGADTGSVFRAAPLSGRLTVGLELQF